MLEETTALPAETAEVTEASGAATEATPTDQAKADGAETAETTEEAEKKVELTPEERERRRMQRGIDRRTKQLAEARAEAAQLAAELSRLRDPQNSGTTRVPADDSEPLSLTRAQIAQMVKAEAEKLAPTLREQAAETERRQGVIQSLAKTWGQEKFDELSSELDDAFGGLADRSGRPKPATEAIFEADDPRRVIEFLADPDNLDEAERIAKMGAVQAGKAIAKLEARLASEPAKDKPKASKAPAPLETIRGRGAVSGAPDPSDTKAWIRWRNEQERKGL